MERHAPSWRATLPAGGPRSVVAAMGAERLRCSHHRNGTSFALLGKQASVLLTTISRIQCAHVDRQYSGATWAHASVFVPTVTAVWPAKNTSRDQVPSPSFTSRAYTRPLPASHSSYQPRQEWLRCTITRTLTARCYHGPRPCSA